MSRFLTQAAAIALDQALMSPSGGFSLDQLMELAGLSVAAAFLKAFPPASFVDSRILALAGPGNNGGDALVAMRHLSHFGYENLTVAYPKPGSGALFQGLVTSLRAVNVTVDGGGAGVKLDEYDIIVDGVFGFSFDTTRPVRPPFDDLLSQLRATTKPILSIDIPSGWDVEKGDVGVGVRMPHVLVSLSAPKLCAKKFSGGRHFLGGRFIPPELLRRFEMQLPVYPGAEQVVELLPDDVCEEKRHRPTL